MSDAEILRLLSQTTLTEKDERQRVELAVELFEKGSQREHEGLLSEAVEFYRRAYKLDEGVDKKVRAKIIADQPPPEKRRVDSDQIKLDISKVNVKDVLNSYSDSGIFPAEEEEPFFFNVLPDEILMLIMQKLVRQDTPAWFSFAMTCRRTAYLGFHHHDIWKSLCELIYPAQVYDTASAELNGVVADQEDMVKAWNYNWEKMLCERPFVKFNGLYISVVNYQREGGRSESSRSWSNPLMIITYYRYVRFFPDGTCLRFLTDLGPRKVVPLFSKNWRENGLQKVFSGVWSLTPEGVIRIEYEGFVPKYYFVDELQIVNGSKHAKHHKLQWVSCYSVDKETTERGVFSMRNERPFAFSRVKSYGENNGE
ncbi:unnamed protein product [Kuraishia capsulata CBS 1993]|uniref:F-box domain-containing protein n=1 Tax=Kuraishia capsulata CBS 1993 TaxID=1382522 RepID=W6MXF9_9ASCO|nr:uncharacterized protein KUCA_T00004805001 [Kuraishia capsulata CBS 1993]CDK28820.1 unnamed protein product [Kuraishia capsulata CBS 1993]